MTTCPSCKHSITSEALKCPNCGMFFDQTSGATAFLPHAGESGLASIHSTESADGARFPAGKILGERYRIVSLLGRGGMGEVYKAEDLKLKQIVALKFLPDILSSDGAALARFQNEVRITRQISHPNVCRVYDIGETQGMHFLSMEFIDGEDLSILLRRIGRLPGDKANEIARQICAGLAAAHDNGVLHRDLKPANIMIDGRGRARVTDFGVSVVAREVQGAEAMSGTPAYMAPEQLTGKEVTQKSDIYSLGLVLYELFTGKRAYNSDNLLELISMHEASSPTSPSSHVQHLDPLVERVILRCLEKDPTKRPASAIQVAAALPGGDPLAAALAAGETPSPEMVAASGEKSGIRPAVAVGLLAAVLVLVIINITVGRKVDWPANLLRENSPSALTHKAEDILRDLGYKDKPLDSATLFAVDWDHKGYIDRNAVSGTAWERYSADQPPPLYFVYRQSPRYLESDQPWNFGWIAEDDPPNGDVAGMVTVRLDPKGRLTYLKAVPPQVETTTEKTPEPDWAPVFAAAGLDPAAFTATESAWMPETGFDTRAAWTGVYTGQPDVPIRLEMASYRGKPVYFNVIAPWTRPKMDEESQENPLQNLALGVVMATLLIGFVGALLLARSNLKRGRGDRKGAMKLGLAVFAGVMLAWAFGADHRLTFEQVPRFFITGIGRALLIGAVVWMFYLALEPYVRRRWPEAIISWSRVLGGSITDPLVGRDVLVGIVAGLAMIMLGKIESLVMFSKGSAPLTFGLLETWVGTRQFIGSAIFANFSGSISLSLFFFFILFLFLIITRRRWLAVLLSSMLLAVPSFVGGEDALITGLFSFFAFLIMSSISLRIGLLTFALAMFVARFPLTDNFSQWHLGYMVAAHILVLGAAAWAFHTSLGGQKLFTRSLLDD